MPGSTDRVATFLRSLGVKFELREFDVSTKNSALAAEALGCSIGEIAKSVVFEGGETIVVVLSGDRRVDPGKLSSLVGSQVNLATPDSVRASTGYPIGGVPPFPHSDHVKVIVDESLTRFPAVWAAGGAPNVVFKMDTAELLRTLRAVPVDVAS